MTRGASPAGAHERSADGIGPALQRWTAGTTPARLPGEAMTGHGNTMNETDSDYYPAPAKRLASEKFRDPALTAKEIGRAHV